MTQKAAGRAAERRLRDDSWCGHGADGAVKHADKAVKYADGARLGQSRAAIRSPTQTPPPPPMTGVASLREKSKTRKPTFITFGNCYEPTLVTSKYSNFTVIHLLLFVRLFVRSFVCSFVCLFDCSFVLNVAVSEYQ
jgi:hypothetical protein